jgi:hypothetical protein
VGGGRATPPAVTDAALRRSTTGPRANIGHVPTICRFFGVSIAMYFDDLGFPHFHARDASVQAKIRIDEVEVNRKRAANAVASARAGLGRVALERAVGELAAGASG